MMLRRALDRLRGMRHVEWLLLFAALAALTLMMAGAEEESGDMSTSLEKRMESVLSCVEGAGQVRVLVNGEAAPSYGGYGAPVTGVVVVASGAGDLKVRLELQQAVQALLGVEAGQIEILSMKEGEG